ncbi:trigger factor [Finegoldia magna]|uniref:trigger factor n=1 Tax=Finegoldia magna TaxID=1260 RepID=UPI000B917A28|nr:trigger factor [Finegoldia magna]OXZ25116.1 trigger factor [Finegoldia magna]
MSAVLVSKEKNQAVFTCEIPAEDFNNAIEESYKKNRSKFSLKGFRKGKVPRKMLERAYGEGLFYEDAVNLLLPGIYEKAIEELELEPVSQPDIDLDDITENNDVKVKFTVDLKPEFELGDYSNLSAEIDEYKVTDSDVDLKINHELESNARVQEVEGREAKENDTVSINFKGFVDDKAFDGGEAEDYELVLGSHTFIPGFEEQIVGHNVGDEFDVNVKFPEDYHEDSLKGQDAKFECKINSIKEKVLPELDDEFVKDVSEFDTLDEYKKDIKEHLEKDNEQRQLVEKQNKSVEALIDATEITVPESMIDNEVNRQFQDFARRVQQMGLNTDQYFQITNTSEEDVKNELRANAELKVKGDLVLEKYIEKEAIESTDEELDGQLKEFAKVYGQDDEEKFIEEFKNSPNVEFLKQDIKRKKALEKLVEITKFETKKAEETKEDK